MKQKKINMNTKSVKKIGIVKIHSINVQPIKLTTATIQCVLPMLYAETKYISEINFKFPVIQGDVVEIGMQTLEIGKTSCTLCCEVRSIQAERTVCTIDKLVYVRVNKYGLPKAHGGMNE